MAAPTQPDRWPEFRRWLLQLSEPELRFVRSWIVRYVNQWGQIPVASARKASDAFTKRGGSIEHVDGAGHSDDEQ